MVEFLFGSLPLVDSEVPTVVFGVTPDTFRVSLFRDAPVVALLLTHEHPNLAMTLQAFESEASRAEDMAARTLESRVKGFMRLGQRTWCDLRP